MFAAAPQPRVREHASAEMTHGVKHLHASQTQVCVESGKSHENEVIPSRRCQDRPLVSPQVYESRDPHPRTEGRTSQSLDEAPGKCRNGAPVDSIHEPLSHNQTVAG